VANAALPNRQRAVSWYAAVVFSKGYAMKQILAAIDQEAGAGPAGTAFTERR